jgi:hypothetical protein
MKLRLVNDDVLVRLDEQAEESDGTPGFVARRQAVGFAADRETPSFRAWRTAPRFTAEPALSATITAERMAA